MDFIVAVPGRGIVESDQALVLADDLGIARGDGVFDAARVVRDAAGVRVDHLERHLARFARSCAAMGMDAPDLDAWRALVLEAARAWTSPGEATVKLIASRGLEHGDVLPGGGAQFLTIAPLAGPSCRPLRVAQLDRGYASDAFAGRPWLLGGVKSLSYAVNQAAVREAERRGADDVLFVSSDGYCLEGPRSGLVARYGDAFVTTPTGATGILDSVTVAVVAEALRAAGTSFSDRLLTPAELRRCDGAWMLSAVRGVCEIVTLDGDPLPVDPDVSARLRALAGF